MKYSNLTKRVQIFFCINETKEISYLEFNEIVNQISNYLIDINLLPGDRVAIQAEKNVIQLATYVATVKAGGVYLPLNTGYTLSELEYFFNDAKPKVIIVDDKIQNEVKNLVSYSSVSILSLNLDETGSLIEQIKKYPKKFQSIKRNENDLAAILYTSGTTGKSKGAMLSHRNLVSNSEVLRKFWKFTENDVLLHMLPIYHTHGLFVACNLLAIVGGSMIFLEKFDAEKMLYLIDKYKVTTSHMVPTQFHRLLQLPEEVKDKYDCSSTRAMIHAAAPCPVHTKQEMIAWWGNSIWEYYAATEGGGTVVGANDWSNFPGTVGKAWPGADIKIILDNQEEASVNEQGTVYMRLGDATKFEYKGDKDKNYKKERLELDGSVYFTVGDIGYLNEEGYLFLCDRKIDMIISGGANIYPAEIESVFLMHPKVSDVAVFGIPNEEWGEEVKAVIELNDDSLNSETITKELMEFASENLAKMKLPRSLDIIEKLPRDENGKLFKRKLRDPYWEGHSKQV